MGTLKICELAPIKWLFIYNPKVMVSRNEYTNQSKDITLITEAMEPFRVQEEKNDHLRIFKA